MNNFPSDRAGTKTRPQLPSFRLDQVQAISMAPDLFKYIPLPHPDSNIRLLELLPGSGRLQCRLKVVKLPENMTPYEPLSYCWGDDQTKEVSIVVDDAPFKIRVNLHAALKRFRYESQVRMLWVDAICINQDEESNEKSFQIPLMRQIYERGQRTLVG